jgi:arylsulfatase A-like enzyme
VSALLFDAPTIVFVLMDDVGWNDVGFHQEAPSTWLDFATPNMDALVAKGVRLTSHYTG